MPPIERVSADRQPSAAFACLSEREACQAKRGQCRQWFSLRPVIETYLLPSSMRASLADFAAGAHCFCSTLPLAVSAFSAAAPAG